MNLKDIARERGTNLKRIADESGIPASTLYAIASGDTNFEKVGISTFMRVAKALGMSAEELYTGETSYAVVHLPDECDELCDIYGALTEEGKRQLMIFARGLLATFPENRGLSEEIA